MEDKSIQELSGNRHRSDIEVECYIDNDLGFNYKMLFPA